MMNLAFSPLWRETGKLMNSVLSLSSFLILSTRARASFSAFLFESCFAAPFSVFLSCSLLFCFDDDGTPPTPLYPVFPIFDVLNDTETAK